ncbi:MAG: hypothetical protein IJD04_08245, partial [Desulfovibrionaceae bacterium]|nr:hypothetical protein [Desulfovibrionaceae bacterium]
MKTVRLTTVRRCRIHALCLGLFAFMPAFFSPASSQAAGWEWSELPGRERVVVELDTPGSWSVSRVGTTTLLLQLNDNATLQPGRNGDADAIFSTVQPAPNGLYLLTNTNAFGYIVSRDGENRVRIDLFDDPIGARWQPPTGSPDNPAGIAAPEAQPPAAVQAQTNTGEQAAPSNTQQGPRTQIDTIIQAQQQMQAERQEPRPSGDAGNAAPLAPPVPAPPESFTETNIAGSLQQAAPSAPGGQAAVSVNQIQQPVAQNGASQAYAPVQPPSAAAPQPAQNAAPTAPAPEMQTQIYTQPPAPASANAQPQAGNGQSSIQQQVIIPAQEPGAQAQQPVQRPRHTQTEDGDGYLVAPINPSDPFEGDPRQPDAQGAPTEVQPATPNVQEGRLIPIEETDKDLVMRIPAPEGGVGLEGEYAPSRPAVQYDEDGNPIEPPPSVSELIAAAQTHINGEKYKEALGLLGEARLRPEITPHELEEVLYLISDATFGLGMDDIASYGDKMLGVTEEALNANLKSPRVPALMLRLGYVNLQMGNMQEAEAYFNLLKRDYPNDENIPLIYYYWGDHFFGEENY